MLDFGMWLSLVERLVRDEEVAGSNPVIPTMEISILVTRIFYFVLITDEYKKRKMPSHLSHFSRLLS